MRARGAQALRAFRVRRRRRDEELQAARFAARYDRLVSSGAGGALKRAFFMRDSIMPTRLLAFLLLLVAGVPAAAETIVIHAGRLIAEAGRPAQGPSTITIVDGRIQSVTAGIVAAPNGA